MPHPHTRLALAVLLVAAPLATLAPPAVAPGTLVADAGDSALILSNAAFTLGGRAFGGNPPYTYAWSFGGSTSRMTTPNAVSTTMNVVGLAAGDYTADLTVTDATSATATDTVKFRRVASYTLLDATRETDVGTLGLLLTERIPFQVWIGTARLDARLDWTDESNDIDLGLEDYHEFDKTGNAGRTGGKPEGATVFNPEPGAWTAVVEPFTATPDTAHVTITAWPDGNLPRLDPLDKYVYGALDTQQLPVKIRRGEAPLTVAWDTDLDGIYETAGEDPVVSLPVGVRTVAVKVTDASGFEHRRTTEITVRDDIDHVLRVGCGGIHDRPFEAMEYSASNGTCYMHGGHHTYDLGGPVTLRAGKAYVRTVEQHFAPPSDVRTATVPPYFPLVLETSLDGNSWTEIAAGRYVAGTAFVASGNDRQTLQFTFGAAPDAFRFLRIREPVSTTQGLAGYLDYSEGSLEVDEADVPDPGDVPGRSRNLTCEADLMEDFFATHPCWFGGIDRWDSASFFHSYYLEDEPTVERLHGSFAVAPWRSDDWFDAGDTAQTFGTQVFVETSVDGRVWTAVAVVPAAFGEATHFDVTLDAPATVRLVRLVADWHPDYADPTVDPLHHREGYFLASHVVVMEPAGPP
ncbi:MAG TPA: PKD domain-containing protein [Candidatus Thermoplasmatota archaeon]|nr:PKD domain-containing protein [Candidatus Thermoplasmatota archaeon]